MSCFPCLCLIYLRMTTIFGAEFDFTVRVEGGKRDCYFQNITDISRIMFEIDYQVIEGGDIDINFHLIDPYKQLLASDVKKMDGVHRLNISEKWGDYQLCFDNSFSPDAKLLFFQMSLEDAFGNADQLQYRGLGAAHPESLQVEALVDSFRGALGQVKNNLNRAEVSQVALRALENRDRFLAEQSFDRVNFWSLLGLSVMLLVALAQVLTIRTLFLPPSSFLNRFSRLF